MSPPPHKQEYNKQNTVWNIIMQPSRELGVEPCVFRVPKSLSSLKPEAYRPQLVGLGPYHHMNSQVWNMERVKVETALKIHKELKGDLSLEDLLNLNPRLRNMEGYALEEALQEHKKSKGYLSLDNLVTHFHKLDLHIRGCYHMFVVKDSLSLAQIMVIDALFLLCIVCLHGIEKERLMASKDLEKLAELSLGNQLAKDEILRDVMVLENQIPIFIMEIMLRFERPLTREIAERIFPKILVNFCKVVSPIVNTFELPLDKALKRAHLLDLLYNMIVATETPEDYNINIPMHLRAPPEQWEETDSMAAGGVGWDILKLIADTLSENVPLIGLARGLLDFPFSASTSALAGSVIQNEEEDVPSIPTASSLSKVGITFGSTAQNIKSISFSKTTKTFNLPVMNLGVNSDVIIRNLVAYEAMIKADTEDDPAQRTPNVGDYKPEGNKTTFNNVEAQDPPKDDEIKPLLSTTGLVLTRHIDLMNELIDTADDVKVLKDQGVIKGNLKNREIATLFNGISKSIELSGDVMLHEIVKDVQDVYNNSLRVRISNLMKRKVNLSRKILLVILALCYFLLLILQVFCYMYNCPRLLKSNN